MRVPHGGDCAPMMIPRLGAATAGQPPNVGPPMGWLWVGLGNISFCWRSWVSAWDHEEWHREEPLAVVQVGWGVPHLCVAGLWDGAVNMGWDWEGLTAGLSVLQAVCAWPNPSRSHGSPSLESSTKSSAASWRLPTHGRSSSSLTRTTSGAEGLGGGRGCAAGWDRYVCNTEGMHLAAWHRSVRADFQLATWLLSAVELQQRRAQQREICILLAL